ncbi:DUF6233 domain-containing protein [Streptomyces sp. A1136]|uniref:DUF6233 domain-containing protein n=1 Tax=Streptomyces sp. A1136 TaxID=2563102 RepID=UPI00109E5F00|nr:DUF6233 domain-containing protein [Streptomyces sp. A1136]THA56121.1 hypothetical protein E6R62_12305 [Streptomyces sp. A1136]
MSDLPPDLPRLRTLETWLAMSLARVREQIAAEEQRLAEVTARLPLAPRPEWEVETDLGRQPVRVHVGGCSMGGKGARRRPLTRDAALRALGVDRLEPCPYCSPDTALGVLD